MKLQGITLVSVSVLSESQSNRKNPERPTLCRSCGAIVGAGQSACAVCGTSTKATTLPQKSVSTDRETIRFARAVLNRPYKFTIILLIANFFVFLLMWDSSGLTSHALWEFSEQVLLAYGAKSNYLINAPYHQWWRFVTPMFIHVNLIHLLVNMYSLWIVGPYVEKLYGSAKFVVFWVLTGIAGVMASYLTVRPDIPVSTLGRFLFKDHDVVSAGASGALFGLVGVLFVFGIKFRRELPEGFKRAFGTGMLPIIMINLFIGYLGRGIIDNAAHIGGLVSGAALALIVQYRRPGERAGIAATWRVLQVAASLLVVFSFFKVAQHLRDPLPLTAAQVAQVENVKSTVFLNYVKAMNDANEVLGEVFHDKQVGNVHQAVKSLQSVPAPDARAEELRGQLIALLARAATAAASSVPSPERGQKLPPKQEQDLAKDFASWRKLYDEWLKGAARTYTGPTQ